MNKSQQEKGARALVSESLRLERGDIFYILVQKKLEDVGKIIFMEAKALGVNGIIREFDAKEFYNNKYPKSIHDELTNDINRSIAGVALVIEWTEKTTGGRLELLRDLMNTTGRQWRIASMPGIEFDFLRYCLCDIREISDRCLDIFDSLVKYDTAEIITHDMNENEYSLIIDLGDYKPIISNGVIDRGRWGNVPSGETFCMPNFSLCNGDVFLRGSLPNYRMKDKEWILIKIINGKLDFHSIKASSKFLLNRFKGYFFNENGSPKCQNSDCLSELGIGANGSINDLTGKPLFDEKKLGTIHLAFGSNSQFNGPLKSCVHHDITIEQVSLVLSKQNIASETLIKGGTFIDNCILELNPELEKNIRTKCSKLLINKNSQYEWVDENIILVSYFTTRGKTNLKIKLGNVSKEVQALLKRDISQVSIPDIPSADFVNEVFLNLLLHEIIFFK